MPGMNVWAIVLSAVVAGLVYLGFYQLFGTINSYLANSGVSLSIPTPGGAGNLWSIGFAVATFILMVALFWSLSRQRPLNLGMKRR